MIFSTSSGVRFETNAKSSSFIAITPLPEWMFYEVLYVYYMNLILK